MKLSALGLHVIRFFESWSASPYDDDGDGNRMTGDQTIGWGHKIRSTDPEEWRSPGFTMSREQGDELLRADIAEAEEGLRRLIGPAVERLNQNQYDALVSFVFNLGEGRIRTGPATLRAMQDGNHAAMPELIRQWRLDNSKVSLGLVARRAVEAWLYSAPLPAGYMISAGALDESVLEDLRRAPRGSSVVLIAPARG